MGWRTGVFGRRGVLAERGTGSLGCWGAGVLDDLVIKKIAGWRFGDGKWWSNRDSNPGPLPCKGSALIS